jgi:REP element-mobilizing transposase RayT
MEGSDGEMLRDLCRLKSIEREEGKVMPNHINMLLSIPPEYLVAQIVDYIKGRSALNIVKNFSAQSMELPGPTFLGQRVLCIYSRQRRERPPKIHEETISRRPKAQSA